MCCASSSERECPDQTGRPCDVLLKRAGRNLEEKNFCTANWVELFEVEFAYKRNRL
jgi:hypothetical protein